MRNSSESLTDPHKVKKPADDAPLVSVILPTYNRAHFIVESVESVLGQTYSNFELIIVDDGSTDDTNETLAPYRSDTRVRYFFQNNAGQASARNRGLQNARGELVSFLDSDDIYLADKLERQVDFLARHPAVDVVYGKEIQIDEHGREISRCNPRGHSGFVTAPLLCDNFVNFDTAMVRRTCFEQSGLFDEQVRLADDYELWLRFSVFHRFAYLPEYFTLYRISSGQISENAYARLESNERILERFLASHGDSLSPREIRKGWCRFHKRKADFEAQAGWRRVAVRDYALALRYDPLWRGPWRGLVKLALRRG